MTIPAAVGMGVLATPLATAVYHAPEAGPVVQVLAVGVYFLGIHQVTTSILQGMGHTALPLVNMGIAAVVKVGLNWSLAALPALGILGAGWATNADFGMAAILNLVYVYRYTGFRLDIASLVKIAASAAVMGLVLYEANAVLFEIVGPMPAIFADILVAAGVYGIILLLLGELTEHDIRRVPLVGNVLAKVTMVLRFYKQ